MNKVQSDFLNDIKEGKVAVTVFLINGVKMKKACFYAVMVILNWFINTLFPPLCQAWLWILPKNSL